MQMNSDRFRRKLLNRPVIYDVRYTKTFMAIDLTFTGLLYIYYIVWALLGAIAGVWIYRDAKTLPALFLNSKPIWWLFASIISGPVWVFPGSSLKRQKNNF